MEVAEWNFTISCCRDLIITMKSAESISNVFLFLLAFASLWILLKTTILHVNLRVFLIAFSFNDFVIAANRIPDILKNDGQLMESTIIRTIKYAGWIMGVVILLDIMMERIFAFWYYRKYDESSNNVPCAAVILLVAQYTVFLILGFSVTQDWVSFEALILVLFTLSILTYVIFPFSQRILLRELKKREQKRFELRIYNVNGRFQNHDIRRSVRMLRTYVVFQGVCWFLAVTVSSYFQFFTVPSHPDYAMLAEQIGYLINSPRAIISMLIPMAYHTGIRKLLERTLKRSSAKTDVGTIRSLTGERLNFTPEQERDIYFTAYQNSWNGGSS